MSDRVRAVTRLIYREFPGVRIETDRDTIEIWGPHEDTAEYRFCEAIAERIEKLHQRIDQLENRR